MTAATVAQLSPHNFSTIQENAESAQVGLASQHR
jgi:hypothetical protein